MASPPRTYDFLSLTFLFLSGLVLLFIVAPLAGLVLDSSVEELLNTARDEEVRRSIWLTVWTSMAATLVMAVAAIPFAYVLARKSFPLKGLVSAIVELPIVIPHSAAGLALLGILSAGSPIGGAAERLGISFVGSPAGIMAAMAFVSIPYLITTAREGFHAVPEHLETAALNLGASPTRVFFTISLPLASRSIFSGLTLMWARGMSEFGAVMFIAYQPMVTPVLIWERFGAFGLSYARPVAVLFLMICLILFVILRAIAWRNPDA
ncbi:MAG: ABC transporter permease [Candidatus Hydrogenedentes bacterium]|nr:ABC transporter permease [Candidatus Hydrogenedentota bacterium]